MLQSREIDFDQFARDFKIRAADDPDGAMASWRDATAGMRDDLRKALGRSINARLDPRARAALRGSAGGVALVFE